MCSFPGTASDLVLRAAEEAADGVTHPGHLLPDQTHGFVLPWADCRGEREPHPLLCRRFDSMKIPWSRSLKHCWCFKTVTAMLSAPAQALPAQESVLPAARADASSEPRSIFQGNGQCTQLPPCGGDAVAAVHPRANTAVSSVAGQC